MNEALLCGITWVSPTDILLKRNHGREQTLCLRLYKIQEQGFTGPY